MPMVRSREIRRRENHLLSSWHSACMAKSRKVFWSSKMAKLRKIFWSSHMLFGHMCRHHRVSNWWDRLTDVWEQQGLDFRRRRMSCLAKKSSKFQIDFFYKTKNAFWLLTLKNRAPVNAPIHAIGKVWCLWIMVNSVCLLIISRCC